MLAISLCSSSSNGGVSFALFSARFSFLRVASSSLRTSLSFFSYCSLCPDCDSNWVSLVLSSSVWFSCWSFNRRSSARSFCSSLKYKIRLQKLFMRMDRTDSRSCPVASYTLHYQFQLLFYFTLNFVISEVQNKHKSPLECKRYG
jgi:hypothetical protein